MGNGGRSGQAPNPRHIQHRVCLQWKSPEQVRRVPQVTGPWKPPEDRASQQH